jgi:hypothetical protein
MPVMQITDSATTIYRGASPGGDGQPNPVIGQVGIRNVSGQSVVINVWVGTNKPLDLTGQEDGKKADMTLTLNALQSIIVGGACVTAFIPESNRIALIEIF